MSSQIYDHLCVWKLPLNSKVLGDKDCLHWIWPVKKKWLLFLWPFHSCAHCIFIFYCCLCKCQTVCYYMPVPKKYHWNISFQKKCSSKYVVKNARNETQFVWPFSIEFLGFVIFFLLNIYTRILDIMKLIEQIHFMVVK